MTDQTIPADAVREIIARYRDGASHQGGLILADLKALLHDPTRPTLADMTDEERAACQWMRADVDGMDGDWLIIDPFDDEGHALVVGRKGHLRILPAHFITPRPDLSGMEWTGTKKPTPALPGDWRLADHEKRGRVMVTNDTPNAAGDVCFVLPADDPLGYDWLFCDPSELTYIDTGKEADQ